MASSNSKKRQYIIVLYGSTSVHREDRLKVVGGRFGSGKCKVTFKSIDEAVENLPFPPFSARTLYNKKHDAFYDAAGIYAIGRDRIFHERADPVRVYRLRWKEYK